VIAGDTFRPGALAQLQQYLEPIGVEVYGDEKEKKATKLIKNGLNFFKEKKNVNLILIDTTGRHKEETALLKEMAEISKISNPTEIILVVDATIGQQAQSQADAFNRATPIGSIILTKMDGSAKGGGALSAVAITGGEIRFYGEGEKIQDLVEFNPTRFVGSLLGMGDIEGLVNSVNEAFSEGDTAELRDAFKKGKLTLRHFKTQMESANKQSSLGKIVSKIPGVGGMFGGQADLEAESQEGIKRFIAICSAMTEEELDNARIIKGSRIQRIARGSGTSPQEVKLLLKQFNQMSKQLKVMRKMRGRRGPQGGIPPGMEGLLGG
jgi:signal recognition particle subunit SRP54